MHLKLSLLENSYDYLHNSIDTYQAINKHVHDEERTYLENTVKLKMIFVTLVQAFELLLKSILKNMHECLIYKNIDSPKETVSIKGAVQRINMYHSLKFDISTIDFINKCVDIRNQYMHYDVRIQTEEVMAKCLKLFEIYVNTHEAYMGKAIEYRDDPYDLYTMLMLQKSKDFNVYRGIEFDSESLEIYKNDLEIAQEHKYFIMHSGKKVKRLKYGEEKEYSDFPEAYTNKYCGDCAATQGEYHLNGCDWEMCPVCKKQVLVCDCIKEWSE